MDVTLTYDWSGTPQAFRDQVGGMLLFLEDQKDRGAAGSYWNAVAASPQVIPGPGSRVANGQSRVTCGAGLAR